MVVTCWTLYYTNDDWVNVCACWCRVNTNIKTHTFFFLYDPNENCCWHQHILVVASKRMKIHFVTSMKWERCKFFTLQKWKKNIFMFICQFNHIFTIGICQQGIVGWLWLSTLHSNVSWFDSHWFKTTTTCAHAIVWMAEMLGWRDAINSSLLFLFLVFILVQLPAIFLLTN